MLSSVCELNDIVRRGNFNLNANRNCLAKFSMKTRLFYYGNFGKRVASSVLSISR